MGGITMTYLKKIKEISKFGGLVGLTISEADFVTHCLELILDEVDLTEEEEKEIDRIYGKLKKEGVI